MGSYLDNLDDLKDEDITVNVCKTLRDIRKSKGVTQTYLAKVIGLHRPLLVEIEGLKRPRVSYETIHRIAKGLDLEINFTHKE